MILSLLFFGEMIVLFLLSRRLNQSLFTLFYRFTHSEHVGITITTLILFPGTVVHELSHLFTAEIMGVRTGKLTLIPERVSDHHIQAGSVMVERTDPFRRTLIGLSPIFVGIILITLISIQLTHMLPDLFQTFEHYGTTAFQPFQHPTFYIFILLGYLLFAISNNMFSSKEDLEGVTPVLIFLGLVLGTTYAVGFRLQLTGAMVTALEAVLRTLTTNIGIVLGINVVLLVLLQGLLYFIRPRRYR